MKIIGLAGHMGAGKDTVAAILAGYGYHRVAFADALREEVADAIAGGRHPVPECLSELAREALLHAPVDEVFAKPTTPRMRALLQQWGTEYRREQDDAYWTKIVGEKIAQHARVAVSDVRFPDEARLVQDMGGKVWYIKRPGHGGNGHISETVAFKVDYIIHNTGSLADLEREVVRALRIQGATEQGAE